MWKALMCRSRLPLAAGSSHIKATVALLPGLPGEHCCCCWGHFLCGVHYLVLYWLPLFYAWGIKQLTPSFCKAP